MQHRREHIDVAKGLSIILVALFHSKLTFLYPAIIEPMSLFRMPLFFFLSGVFFSYNTDIKTYVMRKADDLLKPYFCILFILFFVKALLGLEHADWGFIGIFYSTRDTISWTANWFLTHLFAVHLFVYCLFKYTNFSSYTANTKYALVFTTLVIGGFGVKLFWQINLFDSVLPGLPFSIDLIFITSGFFIAGTILKRVVIAFKPNLFLLSLSCVGFILLAQYTSVGIRFYLRTYDNPILSTLAASFGIYIVLCISVYLLKINPIKRALSFCGRSSIFILIFHMFIGANVYAFLFTYTSHMLNLFTICAIAFIASILGSLAVQYIIEREYLLSLMFKPFRTNKRLGRKKDDLKPSD